jgi:hypothetical protein
MARLTSDEKDGISSWEVVKQSKVPVFWLYYYYPQSVEDISKETTTPYLNQGSTKWE